MNVTVNYESNLFNHNQLSRVKEMDSALLLLPLLVLSTFYGSSNGVAQPTSSSPTALPTAAREFLEAHNQARAAVGVGPLKWSEKLANASSRLVRYQRNKMGCRFANLINSSYGGNQLWVRGVESVTPRMAIDHWVQEKIYYNHANNSCVPNHQCGVYTQVVWKKSLELGCAQAACVKERASLTVCFYNPPGNVVGESPY